MLVTEFNVAILDFYYIWHEFKIKKESNCTEATMELEVNSWKGTESEKFKDFKAKYKKDYNMPVDVYQLAVTLFEIETKLQFSGERFVSFIDNREKIEQMLNSTEGQYKQLLVQMLKMNPNERITIHQVKNQFESLNEVKPNAPTENKGFRASCKRIWNRIRRRRSEYIN